MVRRLIAVMLIACAASASAVGLRDLVAWISAAAPGAAALGGAVNLDGSTEYFTDTSTDLLDGATNVSFVAWVKFNALSDNDGIVLLRSVSRSTGIGVNLASTKSVTFYRRYSGLNAERITVTNVLETNIWIHLAGVAWNGVTNALYVNGVGYYENDIAATPITQTNALRIGGDDFHASRTLNGILDDAGIYTRALSAAEISTLSSGNPVTAISTNGLVRYWKMDDGLSNNSATQALDSVTGTYAPGTGIGAGDWTNGIVPIN